MGFIYFLNLAQRAQNLLTGVGKVETNWNKLVVGVIDFQRLQHNTLQIYKVVI